MDAFEPDVYRCPSDPMPMFVPVYLYDGTVYMDDRGNTSQGFGAGVDGRGTGTRREGHNEGRPFTILTSYRGSCDLYYQVAGTDENPDYDTYRITFFSQPNQVLLMIEGVF